MSISWVKVSFNFLSIKALQKVYDIVMILKRIGWLGETIFMAIVIWFDCRWSHHESDRFIYALDYSTVVVSE